MIVVRDTWLRILVVAIPSVFLVYTYFSIGKLLHVANAVYFLTILFTSEGGRKIIYSSHRWFLAQNQRFRLLALLPAGMLFTAAVFVLSKSVRNLIAYGELRMNQNTAANVYFNGKQMTVGVIGSSVFYGTVAFLFVLLIYETAYHFAKLRHTEKQRDRLANEKLQLELQQLKGIVNPHFLFNNLNSLSSLISEDPQQAEVFLDELTKVFRYLLRNNNTELISLKEELYFIQSYYHLLQTRYGKSITLHIAVEEQAAQCMLPPLTLQLLIENAVKHNKMSKSDPLFIELKNEGNKTLVLSNNLSVKEQRVESTGIGLHSINGRYTLLNSGGLNITKTADNFIVKIPLIASEQSEATMALIADTNDR